MAPDVWGRRVAGGGAAAIVEEAGRHAGRLPGGAPRRAPAADGDAVVVEDQRAIGITARQRRDQPPIGCQSAANRARISRLLGVNRPFIGCEGARSALRKSRSRSRTRSCWATSRSRTIMFRPVSSDGSPARAYAVVRRTRRRGGAVRVAAAPVGCARPRGACACCAREATALIPDRYVRRGLASWYGDAFDGKPASVRAEVPRPPQVVQGLFEKRFSQ